jgi:hypothetical protein
MKKASTSRGRVSKPSAPAPAVRRQIRNPVEVDEAREKALVEDAVALTVRTQNGTDELAEVLGEGFVENVTGANDAINEEREVKIAEDAEVKVAKDAEVNEGGPTVTQSK